MGFGMVFTARPTKEKQNLLRQNRRLLLRLYCVFLGFVLAARVRLYSCARRSISALGTTRTRFSRSSNASYSFGFLMPYAFRVFDALDWFALEASWCFRRQISSHFFVREPLSIDTRKRRHKAILIVAESFVEAKRFFVQIAKRVKRFDADVRSLDATLQKTPEVFDSLRVNRAIDVSFGVTNKVMDEAFIGKIPICSMFVAVDRGSLGDVVADNHLHVISPRCGNRADSDLGAFVFSAIQHAEYSLFAEAASASLESFLTFAPVHRASLRANVCFVNFNRFAFTAKLLNRAVLESEANTVSHVPRGLLRDTESAVQFIAADSVLRVGDQPETGKPLVQRNSRVLENRSLLDAELFFAFETEKRLSGGHERRSLSAALWAKRLAVRPSDLREKFNAFGFFVERLNCLLECLWKLVVAHDASILEEAQG
jgi:hypothetical protein